MKTWQYFTSLLLLSLAGCATNHAEQLRTLDSRTLCCINYSEVLIQNELTTPIDVAIDETSQVIATEKGFSYFYPVKLPDKSSGKTLAIKSEGGAPIVLNMAIGGHLYFLPSVTFLDGDKNKIATAHDHYPIGLCEGFTCSGGLLSRFKIPEKSKYALIHANRQRTGEFYYAPMTRTPPGMTIVAGAIPVQVGSNNSALHVIFSINGKINISVQ